MRRDRSMLASSRAISPPMTQTAATPPSFEAALDELEKIVATMEDGPLPLAASLAAYKRGAELLQYCQQALRDAQQQVQILARGVLAAFEPARDAGGDEP